MSTSSMPHKRSVRRATCHAGSATVHLAGFEGSSHVFLKTLVPRCFAGTEQYSPEPWRQAHGGRSQREQRMGAGNNLTVDCLAEAAGSRRTLAEREQRMAGTSKQSSLYWASPRLGLAESGLLFLFSYNYAAHTTMLTRGRLAQTRPLQPPQEGRNRLNKPQHDRMAPTSQCKKKAAVCAGPCRLHQSLQLLHQSLQRHIVTIAPQQRRLLLRLPRMIQVEIVT